MHASYVLQPCKYRVHLYMLYNWGKCQACNALIKYAEMVRSDGSIYSGIALVPCITSPTRAFMAAKAEGRNVCSPALIHVDLLKVCLRLNKYTQDEP